MNATKQKAMNNDILRRTLGTLGGKVVITRGVSCLSEKKKNDLMNLVSDFNDFSEGNDPHGEHDFGQMILDETKYFFKIDDYQGSENLNRVMTIMRADEY